MIFEFGCGDGLDAQYFSNLGFTVFACDSSHSAIAAARAVHAGPIFSKVDVGDGAQVKSFLESAPRPPRESARVYFGRFFLHSISEDDQNLLLREIENNSSRGDLLCLEFRTIEDRKLSKVFPDHFRRYIDYDRFLEQITKRAFKRVLLSEKGRGLSPYKSEDPFVGRVIVQRE